MVPKDDDEATAQFDVEALRKKAAVRPTPVDLGAPGALDYDSEAPPPSAAHPAEGPPSLTRMDFGRGRDEEHTANDIEIPSQLVTRRGGAGGAGVPNPGGPPLPLEVARRGQVDYASPKVTVGGAPPRVADWNPSDLLDESGVVSSAPKDAVLGIGSPSPFGASSFARVPERSVEVVHAQRAPESRDDPWHDQGTFASPSPVDVGPLSEAPRTEPPPMSLDEPTMVPGRYRAPMGPAAGGREISTTGVTGGPSDPFEGFASDGEPNTIVPRLVPRDRNGRLAYEPSLDDFSSEIHVEQAATGSGEIQVEAVDVLGESGEDMPLVTGDFESFEPEKLAALERSGALETGVMPAYSAHDPVISSKHREDSFGYAEDLATDPARSLHSLRQEAEAIERDRLRARTPAGGRASAPSIPAIDWDEREPSFPDVPSSAALDYPPARPRGPVESSVPPPFGDEEAGFDESEDPYAQAERTAYVPPRAPVHTPVPTSSDLHTHAASEPPGPLPGSAWPAADADVLSVPEPATFAPPPFTSPPFTPPIEADSEVDLEPHVVSRAPTTGRMPPVALPPPKREVTAVLQSTGPSAAGSYRPPPATNPPPAPAWQSEADQEERALLDQGRWEDLCELLLSRLDVTPSPMPRSRLLVRLAGVLEDKLGDYAQAFDGMLEAYGVAPDDPQIVERLEGLAARLDRFPSLVDATMERLGQAKPADRIALLANAIRWYEGPIGRPDAASFYVGELERIDAAHPVFLKRKAQVARSRGDAAAYLELLQRALERTKLPKERMSLHLAIGEAQRIPSEAIRHYEAALEIDPKNVEALLAFERAAAKFDRFAEVEWALRELCARSTGTVRTEAYVRLAELLERRFLKRDEAASILVDLLEKVPDHVPARLSLERCYLALRDYPKVVDAARARAEHAPTPKDQAEAYAFAADIAETKMSDQVAAAAYLHEACQRDQTNEAFLARAAKLADRMQEPRAAAEYRGRLAEILTDPQKRAQQYLQIAASLDDAVEARPYYEKAAKADPGCGPALEALERIARELGDDRGIVSALRRRIDATESQRVKAQLYVELGLRLSHDPSTDANVRAREAFEAAFKADPSNERAASAVLDDLVADGRYQEAAPACELLVTAASRDRDPELLYGRLRTSAKIAIGMGDLGKALGACVAASDALPHERQAIVDLVEILSRAPEGSSLGSRADAAFTRIFSRANELDPDELAKLGKLLAARGEHERAVEVLSRVLEGDGSDMDDTGQRPVPGDGRALFEVLSESLAATGDARRAGEMRLRLARLEPDPEKKYTALVGTIELFAHRARDLQATVPVVEEALRLRPDDHWLLHTAMWLFGELDDWARLAEVLERIVDVQETPERRAKSLFTLAQVVGDKLGDKARAASLYDETLEADKKRLDAFEALTRMLDDLGDYDALERAYRKMIARVRDDGDDELVFTLFKNLAAVYSDRLGNTELAQKALEGAKRVKPDDPHVKDAAVELLIARDELDKAQALLRKDLERDPYDQKSYELLYGVYLRMSKFDRALSTAQVLGELRPSTEEEARFLADYPPFALGEVPGSLVEEAWASHLLHADLDPMLTSIFAWMTPAVCRMRESTMTEAERIASFGKPLTRALTRQADVIRQVFHDAAEILAFGGPDLVVGKGPKNVPFAPALTPYGAMTVNVDALTGIDAILPFVVGKRLAEQRPELAARAFFPAVSELTSMLATAVRVGLGERSPDPATQKLDRALFSVMSDDERASVAQAVTVAQAQGGKLDVKRWSQAADISSMRVGLLLAQDVAIAKKAVSSEQQGPSDLTPREKLGELFLFATGDLYADLRQAIGINLADGGPSSSAVRG